MRWYRLAVTAMSKKEKKCYGSGRDRRGQIIGKRPIIERPEIVDKRLRIGDWEGDTVIGAGHKQAIVSLVERKFGYTILAKVPNKTANLVGNAICEWVKTIIFDNGKEFANHKAIDNTLNSNTYFADPCSSWQCCCNENLNGLLRQYIPKKRPLSTVTENEIKMIEQPLNNRPRKRLGYKTPKEIFFQ